MAVARATIFIYRYFTRGCCFFGWCFMLLPSMTAKMLGASIVAAIGITVVYPSENYAMGLCIGMAVCALLANFRD